MTTPTRHIGDRPLPEMYQAGLEIDCACARCGSSLRWEDCEDCYYGDEDIRCCLCSGTGGFWCCLSSPEWCEADPLPGRDNVKRGMIEWFTYERGEENP